ncbi:MAG: histidine phosphatase family protein [Rhodospirillales bacterium]|nr:histidine phosphatase family protein [Rhodospirillales bacterium]
MRAVLIRHPAVLIAPGICYGRLDLDLHPQAAADAARLRAVVAGCAGRVWSSPARRCRLIAGDGATPDERLRELDFGAWEGLAWDAVPRDALDRWAAAPHHFAPPQGESGAALLARVGAFHAELRARGEDCVVVSHGGPLKLLAALLHGTAPDLLAPAPALGSVSRIAC